MNQQDVLKLAKLSRIEISDGEAETLSHQFDSILNYVGEIKTAGLKIQDSGLKNNKDEFPVRNIFREDTNPHEGGIYTEKILEQAPSNKKDYIKVKRIL